MDRDEDGRTAEYSSYNDPRAWKKYLPRIVVFCQTSLLLPEPIAAGIARPRLTLP